ncbi:hypothetical protein [Micromonospora sp. NPDC049282]|uniref:hypothetical protein n=1 Tax=Micromonospora sp. NPDC049282 TaxID=3364269 RepID=UPI00371396C3
MSERRVTLDDLGAWLIKGNAQATDLTGRFAADPVPAAAGGEPVVPDGGAVRGAPGPPARFPGMARGAGRSDVDRIILAYRQFRPAPPGNPRGSLVEVGQA